MKKRLFTLSLSGLATAILLLCSQHTFAQVSPATMKQIQALLQEKNSRTPAQQKIDSRLLQALREKRGEKMAEGVTLDLADVDADAFGVLKVDIQAEITNAFLSKLNSLGGQIIFASVPYHSVRAIVNLKTVEAIAALPEVKFIQPAVKSTVVDAGMNTAKRSLSFEQRAAKVRAQLSSYMAKHVTEGSVNSQGDADHRAADVRSTYGFLGQGIKIGVLSDSYNAKSGAASDVTKGDLPGTGNPSGYTTPVTVVQDFSGGEDEGRAMLQVIHDLAPAATLYFATADVSEAGFATNIQTLRSTYGCNIIVDDVAYFDEPAFQDGIVAQAVNTVTAAGALYFSSAGNSGSLAKGTSGVFEGDFNDAGSASFSGSSKSGTVHNFGTVSSPVNGDIIKALGGVYNLNWSDAWGASNNDYDLFLVSSGGTVRRSSTNIQSGTQNPYEQVSAGTTLTNGDRLLVFKTTGAAVRALHLNTNRGTLTVATNGQTTGHACAANAFCMAATPAATAFTTGYPTGPYPNPFVSTNKVEPFSSDGPRKKFYNPDGSAITSGSYTFASNGGVTLLKPDLTAADGVTTTFSSSTGLSPFFGTSCAAPHAGAIAALLLSGNPSLTTTQVRNILTSTALDVESSGYDNVSGYGIIQAYQAAAQVGGGAICSAPTGLSAGSLTTTSAVISWTAASGAVSYNLQYKLSTASTFTTVTGITGTSYTLSGLTAGTSYNVQVATVCSGGTSAYGSAITFTTTSNTTVTYCTSSGGSSEEYINKVVLGSISNTSGNNGGYGNFTSLSTVLSAGSSYTATLTPGFSGTSYKEAWTMWIDYNGDGDFVDAGEKVGTATAATTAKTITFTVPTTAKSGNTRIRIQMKYSSASTTSCGTYTYGEVEDYTGSITGGTGKSAASYIANAALNNITTGSNSLTVYPNPAAHGNATVSYHLAKDGNVIMQVVNMYGQNAKQVSFGKQTSGLHNYNLATSGKLGSGNYLIVLQQDGEIIGRTKLVVAQ